MQHTGGLEYRISNKECAMSRFVFVAMGVLEKTKPIGRALPGNTKHEIRNPKFWIPAFAGMTVGARNSAGLDSAQR